MNLNRRMFLGGAISLIAVKTFIPSVSAMGNFAKIYADGINDDSFGFTSLFRNEPVIFDKENIGVDEHSGIVFHKGRYLIDNPILVPEKAKIEFELKQHFYINLWAGDNLNSNNLPFFICEDFSGHSLQNHVVFNVKQHNGALISFPNNLDYELFGRR